MSIEKTKAELLKSLEFDEHRAHTSAIIHRHEDRAKSNESFVKGARWQHAQSAKIAKQLIVAIEVLEFYANGEHLYKDDYDVVKLECEGSSVTDRILGAKARAALAEITKGEK